MSDNTRSRTKSHPYRHAIPNPNGRALVSLVGEGPAPLLSRAHDNANRKTRRSRFLDLAVNGTEHDTRSWLGLGMACLCFGGFLTRHKCQGRSLLLPKRA